MSWLEDLFFLVAFVVAVGLVTFAVYDDNAYPKVGSAGVVAAAQNPEREMPSAQRISSRAQKTVSRTSTPTPPPGYAAPVH